MKENIPQNLTYVFLVHASAYKSFTAVAGRSFPDLQIKFSKKIETHYHVLQMEENNSAESSYDKDAMFEKLPVLAMREELSNFIFLKSVKAYNNVLKFMLSAKEDKDAPYKLFEAMLTTGEKNTLSKIHQSAKENQKLSVSFSIKEGKDEKITTYYNTSFATYPAQKLLFELPKVKVNDKEIEFAEILKEEVDLRIGIVR